MTIQHSEANVIIYDQVASQPDKWATKTNAQEWLADSLLAPVRLARFLEQRAAECYNQRDEHLHIRPGETPVAVGPGRRSGNLLHSWANWDVGRVPARAQPAAGLGRPSFAPGSGDHRMEILKEAPEPRRDWGDARRRGRIPDSVDQDRELGGAHTPDRVRAGCGTHLPSSQRASEPRTPGPGAGRYRRGGDSAFGFAR